MALADMQAGDSHGGMVRWAKGLRSGREAGEEGQSGSADGVLTNGGASNKSRAARSGASMGQTAVGMVESHAHVPAGKRGRAQGRIEVGEDRGRRMHMQEGAPPHLGLRGSCSGV